MPRPSKGARLWLRPARRRGGRIIARAIWIIIDGDRHVATSCFKNQTHEAEKQLAAYIAEKYSPSRHARDIDRIDISDVLAIYLEDCGPRMEDRPKLERCIGRLNDYWGGKMLSRVTAAESRAYVQERGKTGGARTDLETLRAAINHHAKENLHYGMVRVTLPAKGPPRDRWLTRDEAAKLIRACWRYREQQTIHRGRRKGLLITTDKRPLRHLARFILIGLYTGTRAGRSHRPRRIGKTATRSSTSTKASSTDWQSGVAQQTSDRHRRQYRHGCWLICGAGFAGASSRRISWSGRAHRSNRSRPDSGMPSTSRAYGAR
jgi:hypothetical protein